MKIYNLKKLSFESNNNAHCFPKSGTLVKCRGQIGICYTNEPSYSDRKYCKVYLLGENDLPYTTVDYSRSSCKEITPPEGYTEEYGKHLCDTWSRSSHKYSSEGIIFNENGYDNRRI